MLVGYHSGSLVSIDLLKPSIETYIAYLGT